MASRGLGSLGLFVCREKQRLPGGWLLLACRAVERGKGFEVSGFSWPVEPSREVLASRQLASLGLLSLERGNGFQAMGFPIERGIG